MGRRRNKNRDNENDSQMQQPTKFIKRGGRVTKASSNGDNAAGSNGAKAKSTDPEDRVYKQQKTSVSYRKMLQDARIAKKWKQKDLAQKMNVPVSEVQKWEAGKGVPAPNLRGKLNRTLGCKLPKIKKHKKQSGETAV